MRNLLRLGAFALILSLLLGGCILPPGDQQVVVIDDKPQQGPTRPITKSDLGCPGDPSETEFAPPYVSKSAGRSGFSTERSVNLGGNAYSVTETVDVDCPDDSRYIKPGTPANELLKQQQALQELLAEQEETRRLTAQAEALEEQNALLRKRLEQQQQMQSATSQ